LATIAEACCIKRALLIVHSINFITKYVLFCQRKSDKKDVKVCLIFGRVETEPDIVLILSSQDEECLFMMMYPKSRIMTLSGAIVRQSIQ